MPVLRSANRILPFARSRNATSPTTDGDYPGWTWWADALNAGARLVAVGGSDVHDPRGGRARLGYPSTVVWAVSLPLGRYGGGILWLMTLFVLASTRLLQSLRQSLIALRRANPTLRRRNFLSGIPARPGELADVSWFDPHGENVDWDNGEQGLICVFGAPSPREAKLEQGARSAPNKVLEKAQHVMLMLNPVGQPRDFVVPPLVRMVKWRRAIDTAAEPPADIFPGGDGPEHLLVRRGPGGPEPLEICPALPPHHRGDGGHGSRPHQRLDPGEHLLVARGGEVAGVHRGP